MMLTRRKTNSRFGVRNANETIKEAKNVVIFGETGVGKSSLINLIAGKRVSETSSSAAGCTLTYMRHRLTLEDQEYAIWDTAGLGEGTQGSVPAEKAEAYLKQFLQDLSKTSGIDLLVYCVRGTRVRTALLTNYHIFYSAICRKKVPIAIVITGLENQEGNMDTWWLSNQKQFEALNMNFDSYACVTTLDLSVENPAIQERRRISKMAIVKMITETCRTEHWRPAERSWIATAFSDVRAMLSESPRIGQAPRVARVILCNVSTGALVRRHTLRRAFTFHNPVSLSRSLVWPFRSPVSLMSGELQCKLPFNSGMRCTPERLFRVYQVPQKPVSMNKTWREKDVVVKRGADLLIFCVQMELEAEDVKQQWEHFYHTYGGDLSPQIVIVVGADNQRSAEKWWNEAVGVVTKHGNASIAYLPTSDSKSAVTGLQSLITTHCIDYSKPDLGKHMFKYATLTPASEKSSVMLWNHVWENSGSSAAAKRADEDILTRRGIWEYTNEPIV